MDKQMTVSSRAECRFYSVIIYMLAVLLEPSMRVIRGTKIALGSQVPLQPAE